MSDHLPEYIVMTRLISRSQGATIYELAEALEKAGKANDIDTIMSDTDAALETFSGLLDKLSAFYGDEDDNGADRPLMETDTLRSLMDELESNCDNLDLDGMEAIDKQLKGYSYEEGIAGDIEALHKAIADIDTDVCMEIIERVRTAL